jgi:N-carbamoyl-L-amino-acid hydrolase
VKPADDAAFAAQLFESLRAASQAATGDEVGITRDSYGAGESAALDLIDATARANGLAVCRDAAANLVVTLPGLDPTLPAIACGSHLDSVPRGGNYDGAAGVVAGLLALIRLHDTAPVRRRSIRLYGLRGEESAAFGRAYLGSRALFGQLSAIDLEAPHAVTGRTLATAMAGVGADLATIAAGARLVDPASLALWLELHIEQGPVLVARELPVAIVTGIRGNIRHRAIECIGEAGHSGAVPRWLRRDAVFAVAELLTRLDHHWQVLLAQGHDLVMTSGIIGTDPAEHSIARIPGRVCFSFEARSQSPATLDAVHALLLEECRRVEEDRGVAFRFDARLDAAPARMDPSWVERLQAIAASLGLAAETMASGAGHDAAVFANQGVPSAMIFIHNAHGSHNPDEAMAMDDFMTGVTMLCRALEAGAAS